MARPRFAERLYRLLLACYPGEFRDDYAHEMLLVFRERLSHDRRAGARAVLGLWTQVLLDAVVRAPGEHLDVLQQDLRHAVRSLRRAPLFTFTAVATLALGVGANTAIFSVVHAVALRPLPYDAANRLVRIWEHNDALSISGFAVSLPNFESWRARARTLELAAWRDGSVTLRSAGDPVRAAAAFVSPEYFRILRATPVLGRTLVEDDAAPQADRVALVAEAQWRRSFGGDPAIVGTTVIADGQPYSVVGVLAERSVPLAAEFFVPLRLDRESTQRDNHVANVVGRLRDGHTLEQARQEMEAIARQLQTEFPGSNAGWSVEISTLYDWLVPERTRRALFVLLGAVCCVLLIASANVANLMLGRAAARKREMAVRLAIGAARRRLVRHVLTEGLVVALAGGVAGVLLAYWAVPLMRSWLPPDLPRGDEASVDATVLLVSLGVCVVTGLSFAVLPALASSRGDLVGSLKDGARGTAGDVARARQLLAATQVALATMLLVGAALLVQSVMRLRSVELGFDPVGITTGMTGLPADRFKAPDSPWDGFYRPLLERLASAPGVEAVALSSAAPFGGGNTGMPVQGIGETRMGSASLQTDWRMVSPGYFQAMRIPLLRGRYFEPSGRGDRDAIIVSAVMARRMWGGADPVGRRIETGPDGRFTVVGVVGDVRNLALSREPAPTMYLSTTQYVWPDMTIIVRAGEGAGAPALLRETVRELDGQLAVHNILQMGDLIDQSAAQPRLNASLTALFAFLAALLAALGIYGVLAYLVSQRNREIAIRMALGAGRPAVLRLFLARGVALSAVGLAAGVLGALAVARWLGSMLFEVNARDPGTIAAAAVMVAAIATVASYLPAWRASRIDPLVALRSE